MEHVVTIIVAVSGVLLSTTIITLARSIWKKSVSKAERINDMDKKMNDMNDKIDKKMNDMDNKMDKIADAIGDITEKIKVLEPMKDSQLMISRYRLSRLYEKYDKLQEITQAELDEFLDMYEPYRELDDDGEGSVHEIVRCIKELPIVKCHKGEKE